MDASALAGTSAFIGIFAYAVIKLTANSIYKWAEKRRMKKALKG